MMRNFFHESSLSYKTWKKIKKDFFAMVALIFILLMIFSALFAPWIAPHDPTTQILKDSNQGPSGKYLLGTDEFGRDILSRLIYGSRISLQVGFISMGIAAVLGTILGALAGYFKGWVDVVIMWLVNVVWSFPFLLFVIAITVALGRGITQVYIAVGLASWVGIARIMRGQFLSLREMEYVEAAKAMGYGHLRIIFLHILPNTLAPLIVVVTLGFASAILAEAALSFLGLGAQPPTPSWGQMINTGYGYLTTSWWMAAFPGLAIMFAVLAFNILGDSLRDALDPRLK